MQLHSDLAAKHYNLEILDNGIEDFDNNYTRFLLLSTTPVKPSPGIPAKTSLVLTLSNTPGALFKVKLYPSIFVVSTYMYAITMFLIRCWFDNSRL